MFSLDVDALRKQINTYSIITERASISPDLRISIDNAERLFLTYMILESKGVNVSPANLNKARADLFYLYSATMWHSVLPEEMDSYCQPRQEHFNRRISELRKISREAGYTVDRDAPDEQPYSLSKAAYYLDELETNGRKVITGISPG